MLPKAQRLHTAADFRRLRGRGNVWRSPSFVALSMPNRQQSPRLGIVVSAKIGKSVIRKRTSRVLRHAFRDAIKPQSAYDIVLIARPYAKDKTATQIGQELAKMAYHLKL